MNSILKMSNVSKSFGGVHALVDVHLTVGRGEIHALMGENGAGKSTLMNVLTGVIPLDKGTIEFDGKEYPRPTIRQMEEAGIAFVHQELSVINDLTVYENIFLNRELMNKWHILESKKMIAQTRELFALAREQGLFLMEAEKMLFLPAVLAAKEGLAKLGKVTMDLGIKPEIEIFDALAEEKIEKVFGETGAKVYVIE